MSGITKETVEASVAAFSINAEDLEGVVWSSLNKPQEVVGHAAILKHILDSNLEIPYTDLFNASTMLSAVRELVVFMKEQSSVFVYEGFNPGKFFAYLWSLHTNSGDSKVQFARDMAWCCLIVLMRGPSVIKETSLMKMPKEGREICQALKKKYNIVEKVDSKGPYVVTLSRIAACLPILVIELMSTCDKIDRPVQVKALEVKYGLAGYPPAMRTNIWFSIVPADPKYKGLVSGLLVYCYAEGDVINQKQKDYKAKSKDERMSQVMQYARAAMNSPIIDWEKREEIITSRFATIKFALKGATPWTDSFNRHFSSHIDARDDMVSCMEEASSSQA